MKTYLFLLIGLAGYAPVAAQSWRIIPAIGLNAASVSTSTAYRNYLNSGSTTTDYGLAFKLQLGAFAEYLVSDRFALRTGLFYSPKGASLTYKSVQAGYTAKGSYRSTYLEVPLLANIAIGQKGYRILGGPVFGVALGGQITVEPVTYLGKVVSNGATVDLSVGSSLADELLPTESSLLIGVLRERERFGGLPLEIGLYSQIGLTNWDPGLARSSTYSIRNSLVGFRIGYYLEVGR